MRLSSRAALLAPSLLAAVCVWATLSARRRLDSLAAEFTEGRLVVNPHPFHLLHGPRDVRSTAAVRLYFVVHSAVDHADRRDLIRRSFGSQENLRRINARLLFALGSVADQKLMAAVFAESATHGDILQSSFIDTYHNITFKAVSWLKQLALEPSAPIDYVVKVDDDTFVDTFHLLSMLLDYEKNGTLAGGNIIGRIYTGTPVIRDKGHKWALSPEEYPHSIFTPYAVGAGYILSGDLIRPLFLRSLGTRFIRADDFYVTGALPMQLSRVSYLDINKFVLMEDNLPLSMITSGKYIFLNPLTNALNLTERMNWWTITVNRTCHEDTMMAQHLKLKCL